jgi:hypothetical protein
MTGKIRALSAAPFKVGRQLEQVVLLVPQHSGRTTIPTLPSSDGRSGCLRLRSVMSILLFQLMLPFILQVGIPTRSSVIGGCNSPHSHRSSVIIISAVRYLRNRTGGTASRTPPAQPPQCATLCSRTGHVPSSIRQLLTTSVPLTRDTLLSTRSLQTRPCTAHHPCAHSFLNFRKSPSCSRLTASSCSEATSWSLP